MNKTAVCSQARIWGCLGLWVFWCWKAFSCLHWHRSPPSASPAARSVQQRPGQWCPRLSFSPSASSVNPVVNVGQRAVCMQVSPWLCLNLRLLSSWLIRWAASRWCSGVSIRLNETWIGEQVGDNGLSLIPRCAARWWFSSSVLM